MKKDTPKKNLIGLIPKKIYCENRLIEVKNAIERYYNADLIIPIEWVKEYNELIIKLK